MLFFGDWFHTFMTRLVEIISNETNITFPVYIYCDGGLLRSNLDYLIQRDHPQNLQLTIKYSSHLSNPNNTRIEILKSLAPSDQLNGRVSFSGTYRPKLGKEIVEWRRETAMRPAFTSG